MSGSKFVYVTFIRSTPQEVWRALTEPAFQKKFWFDMHQDAEWKPGGQWKLVFEDGRLADSGEVLEAEPGKRAVISWHNQFRPELQAEGPARCTYEIEEVQGVVKLTITHTSEKDNSKVIEAVSGGWPKIIANLKSLLETGKIVFSDRAD